MGSFSPERFEKLQSDRMQRLLRSTPHLEEDLLVLEFHKKSRNRWVADTSDLASSSSSQPVQAQVNQATMAQPPWIQNNASPISFEQYHALPKNPTVFCSKFFINDPNCTVEEHIKVFEDALCSRRIQHEDVACRLFPYSLGDDPYSWFVNLPVLSVTGWVQLKEAFIAKFGMPTTPLELHRMFVDIRRHDKEIISSLNNRFHTTYMRLQAPYTLMKAGALEAYYSVLDSQTAMFTRIANPAPTMLNEAYTKAIEIGKQLGQQGMEPPSIRFSNNPVPQLTYQAPTN